MSGPSRQVVLIAGLLGLTGGSSVFAQTTEPIAAVRLDADGDFVPDRIGETVTASGIVSLGPYLAAGGEVGAYLQDNTGGIRLVARDQTLLEGLARGDVVRVTGTVGQYRATELIEIAQIERLAPGSPPEPKSVLVVDAASEELSGRLVRVMGRVRVDSDLMIEDESGRMLLYLRSRYLGDPGLHAELVDGRGAVVTGIVEQYDRGAPFSDAYRLVPRDEADLEFTPLQATPLTLVLLSLLVAVSLGWLTMWVWQTQRRATALTTVLAARQALYETQRRFVADAGHEIRTPLTVLRGDIEIALLRARSAGDYESVLRRAIADLDRVAQLADDLLALAATDDRELHVDPDVDVGALLDSIRDRFQARAADAAVEIDIDADLDLVLEADAGLVDRALSNLVDNALKYGEEGGVVRLEAQSREGCVQIAVSDRGPGVPEAGRTRLFDRFYRGDPNSKVSGSGLGLSVVRSVMERHGGRVSVEHREKGICFTLTFPAPQSGTSQERGSGRSARWRKRLQDGSEPASGPGTPRSRAAH